MVRSLQSETAPEEDEPVSSVGKVLRSQEKHGDLSDTCSEEDSVPIPLSEKPATTNVPAPKRKLKSVIGGKAQQKIVARRETPSPPISPPSKRAKPTDTAHAKSAPISAPVVKERVFRHSGPKKYSLEDGPVALIPYETGHARGGFAVRIEQKGQFVGLISGGEEVGCRKLLSEGWKGELRYLGGGKSEIVMRDIK